MPREVYLPPRPGRADRIQASLTGLPATINRPATTIERGRENGGDVTSVRDEHASFSYLRRDDISRIRHRSRRTAAATRRLAEEDLYNFCSLFIDSACIMQIWSKFFYDVCSQLLMSSFFSIPSIFILRIVYVVMSILA